MIIESIRIKEGMYNSFDTFSNKTLIYSNKNSCGKSTYLRLLFYSLGYAIPAMKGIKYNNIETEIIIIINNVKYSIKRQQNLIEVVEVENPEKIGIYTLPIEHEQLLKKIFNSENTLILKNLLGIMYIDQEKGWTLLNRGTVIGRISFNIEELLAGLVGLNYIELINERKKLEKNLQKYSAMININNLVSEINENTGNINIADEEKNLLATISLIKLKVNKLKEEIKVINENLNRDKQLGKFIESMDLYIQYNDKQIKITNENICNYNESNEYLEARKQILINDLHILEQNKKIKEDELNKYYESKNDIFAELGDSEEVILNRQLSQINFNEEVVNGLYNQTKNKISKLRKIEKTKIQENNDFLNDIYNNVLKYSKFLQIDELITGDKDYILTDDLKSLSGAKLQKLVFAFKLAFLKVIEKELNEKLIMVLDSPKGKELDDSNFNLIMELINAEIPDNQVIIASIYDNFKYDKKITLKNRAIEERENK